MQKVFLSLQTVASVQKTQKKTQGDWTWTKLIHLFNNDDDDDDDDDHHHHLHLFISSGGAGTVRALTVKDHGFRVLTQHTGRLADVGAEVTLRHVHDDEVERDGILGLAVDLYPIPSGYRLDLHRN